MKSLFNKNTHPSPVKLAPGSRLYKGVFSLSSIKIINTTHIIIVISIMVWNCSSTNESADALNNAYIIIIFFLFFFSFFFGWVGGWGDCLFFPTSHLLIPSVFLSTYLSAYQYVLLSINISVGQLIKVFVDKCVELCIYN